MKNPFKQPLPNATPAMRAVWVVVQVTLPVAAVALLVIFATQIAIYNAILPTVRDTLYTHPIQVMRHKAYLSDFLYLAFWGAWWVGSASLFVGVAVVFTYKSLNEREKEKKKDILIDWMNNRSESDE